jgi:hypothetical protein
MIELPVILIFDIVEAKDDLPPGEPVIIEQIGAVHPFQQDRIVVKQ